MRDGIKLSTDLYFPVGAGPKLPVILIRTPYNKAPYRKPNSVAHHFAGQGYIVAVQDTRGRYTSEGNYTAFAGDVTDGYDTTDWLSKQSWSNGKIGTYGCSYVGDVQILQAQLRHPNLTAMIPQAAGSSIGAAGDRYYYFGARKAGNLDFASGLGWFSNEGNKDRTKPAPQDSGQPSLRKVWGTLPLVGMVERAGGAPSDWNDIVSREPDRSLVGSVRLSEGQRAVQRARAAHRLLVRLRRGRGAARVQHAAHQRRERTGARQPVRRHLADQPLPVRNRHDRTHGSGRRALSAMPGSDTTRFICKWFDHWLKGIDNGVTKHAEGHALRHGQE